MKKRSLPEDVCTHYLTYLTPLEASIALSSLRWNLLWVESIERPRKKQK